MSIISAAIQDYMEELTYKSDSEFTYNYRVVDMGDNYYEVYIINSFAEIIYSFSDVREEEGEESNYYSAVVDFVSCKITPFEADSNTDYYLDGLNKYIERCKLVAHIMDRVDVYSDPEHRTYFG